ncbi:META domain-containing protein [Pelagibius marinus]|uniref:META domain-containing protein n=1 Tax=Pelagibius marinus TaxID=2762760 RepID=UPI001873145A|nr:META domain-containing protein [Pelagibius marinus]
MNLRAWNLSLLPLAAAGLAACALGPVDTNEAAEPLFDRTWVAEEMKGLPAAPQVQSSLQVAADGKVSGHTGCNGYFGSVIIDGQAMSFGNLGSTRIACPEPVMVQEDRLLSALDGTRGYRLQDDNLLLLDGAGDTLARFRAKN